MKHLLPLLLLTLSITYMHALEVRNLRAEDYCNPIGIDVSTPHLSWQLVSDARSVTQQSYCIRIATDAAMNNVVWTSGQQDGHCSVDVLAQGFSAQPRTRYYWQVTVTDNYGNTASSREKAYFETAFLDDSQWSDAQWIKATRTPVGQVSDDEEILSYEISLDFEVKNQAAGIIFGTQDHNNFYMWQFSNATGTARFRPHKWTGGSAACLTEKTLSGTSFAAGKTHSLRIVVTDAKKVQTYLNGTLIDTRTGSFPFGEIGFRQFGGSNPERAYFDNVRITSQGRLITDEDFSGTTCIFDGGEIQDGRFYASGPSKYFWQKRSAKQVRYDVDVDITLINHNASVCFGATGTTTYMMWALCTKDVTTPVLRRHAYNNDALTYSDTPLTLTQSQLINHAHRLHIECEAPYIRTYIDGTLVDTYEDAQGILDYGDVGFRVSAYGESDERAYFDNLLVTDYDSQGNATTRLSEDFEGQSNPFFGAEVVTFQGSRQLYMMANKGFRKRLMQADGSIVPGNPILRQTFVAHDRGILRARLYATGLGVYNVYINGERVGQTDDDGNFLQDELKPGSTDYNKTLFYTTHDVTRLITAGANAIGAELSSGWWNGAIAHGVFGNKDLAFRGLLIITYDDGTEQRIPTDLTWTSHTNGPLRSGDIYDGEQYDARRCQPWSTASFDASDWYQTAPSNDFTGQMQAFKGGYVATVPALARQPRTIQVYDNTIATGTTYGALHLVQQCNQQQPIVLGAGQTAVYDMAQNASGWVSFRARGKAGTHLRFRFAEMRNETGDAARGEDGPAGSVYLTNLRTAAATLYYTLAGDSLGEAYHPTTTYFGFRYVEVTASDSVELSDVVGQTLTTNLDESSSFQCSHPDINQLYSNIMWGQRSNFISVPTDCPQRDERLGWGADTQVFSMAGLYNADSRNFYKKWVQDMRDSQRQDGAYPLVAPYIWGDRGYGQGGWAEAGLIVPYNVYLMTGDKQIMRDNYSSMQRHMQWCAAQSGDGYLYNGSSTKYGDWLAYQATDKRYTSVCYYAYAAQLMRDMAQALSESDDDQYARDAQTYQTLYENIRQEWQGRYLNAQKTPTQETQCAYIMALQYNLLPDATSVSNTVKKLQSAIRSNSYTLNTGFLGTAILNQTLSDYNLNTEAYTILLQRNCPSWLYSIDQGATTMWERWNSYTKANGMGAANMNSFNHYAYGAVADWMYRYMAGISPDKAQPGFHHFILQPTPDDRATLLYRQQRITWTDATYHSDYGPIRARWQWQEKGRISYEVQVPANTTATLYMPCPDGYEVHESGIAADKADGITLMGYENGKAILQLSSGSYLFSTAIADGITDTPSATDGSAPHYTLHGIQLPSAPTHKGIYIRQGKKIVY